MTLPEWKLPSAALFKLWVERMQLACLLPGAETEGDPVVIDEHTWTSFHAVNAGIQRAIDAQAARIRHGTKGGRSRVVWREENEQRHRLVIAEAQKFWQAYPSDSVNKIASLIVAKLSDDRLGLSTVRRIITPHRPKR